VQCDAPPIARIVSTGHLPQAGDSRSHGEIMPNGTSILEDLFLDDRPGADQAHLALQHVPQLRQLVEARPAQQAADASDARVVLELMVKRPLCSQRRVALEQLLELSLGIRNHRAELVAREALAALPDARVTEEHWAAGYP